MSSISDWLSQQISDHLRQSDIIIYGICLPIVCAFGIFGNISSLLVFWDRRPPSFIFYRCLAASDLFNNFLWIINIPLLGYRYSTGTWAEAFYYAHLSFPLHFASTVTGGILVLGLAIDRYVAICHPLQARYIITRHVAHMFCLCAVILAILWPIPLAFGRSIEVVPMPNATVTYYHYVRDPWEFDQIYKIGSLIGYLFLAHIPITVLTSLTLYRFLQLVRKWERRQREEFPTDPPGRPWHLQRRLIKFVMAIVITYLILVTPSFFADETSPVRFFSDYDRQEIYRHVAYLLTAVNSSVNFYIYITFSSQFKLRFISLFSKQSRRN